LELSPLPILSHIKEELPSDPKTEIISKKRKLEMTSSNPSFLPYSFSFAPFDFFFNRILSYEQVLDTICQSICSQLIFNRNYFLRSGLDPQTILQSLMQKCTVLSVDFREFPGKLMSNFFLWLYECVFGVAPVNVPTVYCLVCGCPDSDTHDIKAHGEFYNSLDQPLLENWKTKASNFYDVLKEMISFLLKYPNSRQSFRSIMENYLHCPFCSRKNGTHCLKKHEEWTTFYKFDYAVCPSKEPEKSDNVDTYTKSSFEFLMEQMPFQIPSFLLSLSNVQSFCECLVAMWKSLRLYS